ncbi:MAG TPA: LLM class flavin-dependent oxidoreductase [Thermoanaerobaculia bacterium]
MIRFHWMLPKAFEVRPGQTPREAARYRVESIQLDSPSPKPDMDGWLEFARTAEDAGIESVLISFSRYEPEPFMVACAMGQETARLKYIVAYRSGLMGPTSFVQQINTLSALIDGRVAINIVAGSSAAEQRGYGDFLPHDERYARAEEFLAAANAFWREGHDVDFDGRYYKLEKGTLHTPFVAPGRRAPEIYVSGHSEQSMRLAATQGTCWLRAADTPESLRPPVARMRGLGIDVCLRACVICRPTREEALRVAQSLLPDDRRETTIALKNDSRMYAESGAKDEWLNRTLWTGLVPHYGPVWTTLVGTPEELAGAFLAYKEIGVNQFILSGWPEVDEVSIFGRDVIPRVRDAERRQVA